MDITRGDAYHARRNGAHVSSQDPQNPLPAPLRGLLSEALAIYLAAPQPFVMVSGIAIAIFTAVALIAPSSGPGGFVLSLVQIAVVSAAQIAFLVLAIGLQAGQKPTIAAALPAIAKHGLPYGSGTLLLGLGSILVISVMAPIISIALAPFVALFLLVRVALFGPALVKEPVSIALAFGSSFQLTRGRWMRSFLILLIAAVLGYLPIFILLAPLNVFTVGIAVLLLTLTVPFDTVVTLLLYEDYARLGPIRRLGPGDNS